MPTPKRGPGTRSDLFAKAGAARWTVNANQSSAGQLPPSSFFAISDQGTSLAWGLGAQAQIKNFGARPVPRICGAELWRIRYSLLTKLMI
jgi:hypothetical protein